MINVHNVSGGYGNGFRLQNIDFQVEKGEFFGIIGPNGSGKTTLVKMMSGILESEHGTVMLHDRKIGEFRPKQLAQKLAVLPQLTEQSFRFTVKDTVALGRYAHQTGLFTTLTEKDEQIIANVMSHTHIADYADATIDQLSGGERQRVFLAQALAQEPEVIILDEPTNHLDLTYQKELLDLLNAWTNDRELTVIAIFHDLNLASLYCDRLLLLNKGRVHICDLPNEVIQHEHILKVYGTDVENCAHPAIPKLQVMLTPEQHHADEFHFISEDYLKITDRFIAFEPDVPLKTVSTNPFNRGNGWYKKFVNHYIESDIHSRENILVEMNNFLTENNFDKNDTAIMLTTDIANRAIRMVQQDGIKLLVVVTASAVDSSSGIEYMHDRQCDGTINTWIFIEGKLLDYVFTQAIVTATEAKTRALQEMNILDQASNTRATGNSTDNILIAATQSNMVIQSATTASSLGAHIGKAVYDCTLKALRMKEHEG